MGGDEERLCQLASLSAIDSTELSLPVLSRPEWAGRYGRVFELDWALRRSNQELYLVTHNLHSKNVKELRVRADVGLGKENEENKAGRWKQIRVKQQEMWPAVVRRSQCTALTLNHIIFSELTNSLLHPSACCHFNLYCTKNILKKM